MFVVVFLILLLQGRALWGDNGLLPISDFVAQVKWPSLFNYLKADTWIRPLAFFGLVAGCLMLFGFVNLPILLVPWLVQLSFVNSGQLFYGYGWEIAILEFGFLSFFMVPLFDPRLNRGAAPEPPLVVIWALRWMLFRLMLGAGLIKIRGDSCWHDLTCLVYHYETQPNPHPFSIFFHFMPVWFHQLGVLFNHFVELIVPFGFFGPRRVRIWAGVLTIIFQITIILSGNLAWLNWLTIVLAFSCFDDEFLMGFSPSSWRISAVPAAVIPHWRRVLLSFFALAIIYLSIPPAINLVSSQQAMNTSYDVWHLVNSYGAFGVIGRERTVVTVEGSQNGQDWTPYGFNCWTGDIKTRPCLVTPYLHHLDWQMWFSAMRPELQEEWLLRFAVRLLENDPEVLSLLKTNPFAAQAPKFIKMDLYRYRFADWEDWPEFWWQRDFIRSYMGPLSLENPMARKYARRP